jgi:hypothetical protein
MNKRIGVFELQRTMLENDFALVVEAFYQLQIVSVRAEMMYHRDAIEYTAISPAFREVALGERPPRYLLIVKDGVFRAEEVSA